MNEGRWSIPLADVLVDDELVQRAADVLRSGWWTMGPRVDEFEQAFARACEANHAFAVSSGTAALHLALLATGCGAGDEVVLPSLNFVAAANAGVHTGATPVFCDIHGEHDLNLHPADMQAAVSERTKALLLLHYGGHPCDMDAVLATAHRFGLAVIEDAAHAPGATWRGRACGALGDVGCFSFFSNKNLPVGEGGMVVTNDPEIAERVRLLRSHGMTTLTWDRHRGHAPSYDVLGHGLNYRLDELRAAIGLVQLERLPAANEARSLLVARYERSLASVDGVAMPFSPARGFARPAHHLAVAVLSEGVEREAVRQALASDGIQTSVHYPPIHRFSAYRRGAARPLPTTDRVAERILTLPLYPHLSEEQVDAVADSLTRALDVSTRHFDQAVPLS
jgi:dTDP-4-amino-4,6-dideoxygalactose transaminase